MRKLVLWDIDGTLIRCGKSPRNAIVAAMEEVFGTRGDVDNYPFSGKTDPQIIYDVMTAAQMDEQHVLANMHVALAGYVARLEKTLMPDEIRIFEGIVDLLNQLSGHNEVIQGLLTGNVIEGARIKLSRAGLGHYFFNGKPPLGAFGSDARHRPELPAIAVQRAWEMTGRRFESKDIVIIGDSPYDVLCGKHLNVRSIAVATGWHSVEDLKPYEPDAVYTDFSNTSDVLKTILA
ncbi:MAG TPA: haloacid dehalogenase-like hydrolase [bacterium]|nr:haloacid dehalogenase-like hydrolase [bacterium]HNF87549.1 haloacid dehalogenase-like hydrolase [bacterium]